MIRNLDPALLRTFVSVADRASMTAAANALQLTQGAVSQQIKRLEELFGATSFERARGGLRMTAAGERPPGKADQMIGLNDGLWAEMTAATVGGAVRLGAPLDLMGSDIVPAPKTYADLYPQVEISLFSASSPELVEALAKGAIDIAVMEEPLGPTQGECLLIERLVWVGARAGSAHLKHPLPICMVAETCAFRPVVLAALREGGRNWRTVFENGNIKAATATAWADLAVTVWLASMVPSGLQVLPGEAGLPELPPFVINLHLPRSGAGAAAAELARHIRHAMTRQPHPA